MVHLLTITLVILKALGFISFGWFWVFLPSFIGPLITLSMTLAAFTFAGAMLLVLWISEWLEKRKK